MSYIIYIEGGDDQSPPITRRHIELYSFLITVYRSITSFFLDPISISTLGYNPLFISQGGFDLVSIGTPGYSIYKSSIDQEEQTPGRISRDFITIWSESVGADDIDIRSPRQNPGVQVGKGVVVSNINIE